MFDPGVTRPGSVSEIVINNTLGSIPQTEWPAVFAEFARVLRDGGRVRISEASAYPALIDMHLERAGLTAQRVVETDDGFVCEGVRMTRILFSPHCDDESLYASGLILMYRPRIVVCCSRSDGDYGERSVREAETREAMEILGGKPVEFWNGTDLRTNMRALGLRLKPSLVFAPNVNASHPDHVAVAEAALDVFDDLVRTYHTYNEAGNVTSPYPAPFEPEWAYAKLRALSRYRSQATHPRACEFFRRDQREYLGEA